MLAGVKLANPRTLIDFQPSGEMIHLGGLSMSVQMQLSRILIRELVDYQVIELREITAPGDDSEARTFPIVIGLPEAQAIERRLSGTPIRRPQTHDLLGNAISALGGTIERIEINDLSEHTFFALLHVKKQDGEQIEIDSRPSDAIALGVATGTPIFVAEHVIESAIEPDLPGFLSADDEDDETDESGGDEPGSELGGGA